MKNQDVQAITGLTRMEVNDYARQYVFYDLYKLGWKPGQGISRRWSKDDIFALLLVDMLRTQHGGIAPGALRLIAWEFRGLTQQLLKHNEKWWLREADSILGIIHSPEWGEKEIITFRYGPSRGKEEKKRLDDLLYSSRSALTGKNLLGGLVSIYLVPLKKIVEKLRNVQ